MCQRPSWKNLRPAFIRFKDKRRIVSHGTREIIKRITPISSNLRLGAFVREEKAGKGVREMEEETRTMRPLSGGGKRGTV